MNKYFVLALLALASVTPAFAQEEVRTRRQQKAEPTVTVVESQTADVPAEIEIADGEQVRRYRLFPLRGNGEPRTEEYVDPAAQQPGVVGQAPALAQPTGSRLERLGSIGDFVVPLLAALLGATAGPKASSILSTVWAALRGRSQSSGGNDPLSNTNAVDGVIKIANVLKQLAPVFAAIEQLSKNVPNVSTPTDVPATTTPAKS